MLVQLAQLGSALLSMAANAARTIQLIYCGNVENVFSSIIDEPSLIFEAWCFKIISTLSHCMRMKCSSLIYFSKLFSIFRSRSAVPVLVLRRCAGAQLFRDRLGTMIQFARFHFDVDSIQFFIAL